MLKRNSKDRNSEVGAKNDDYDDDYEDDDIKEEADEEEE